MPENTEKQADTEGAKAILGKLLQPRMILIVWMWLGGAFLAYVLIAASIPQGKPRAPKAAQVLTGEMAGFQKSFPSKKAPFTQFEGPNGMVNLDAFAGKVVLVNLWATWCAPCIEEMPSLDRLQGALGSDQFQVVALAADPLGREKAQEFFTKMNIENLLLYTDKPLDFPRAIGAANVLPTSILYDAKGREVGRLIGSADWSGPDAQRLIQAVIAGQEI